MARKTKRPSFPLLCSECKKNGKTVRNYVTDRNVINTTTKLEEKKHCPTCRKHTLHIEGKMPPHKKR
ncbi:MAG: hypothetical protein ACD_58C00061G0001 [uncultured bacterium]|nr:MAG: hypothetical protein ACD_58C00061G0001 [uncultured bacterium]